MSNLLSRFVDFATGEVTADVNNAATTTDVLNTEWVFVDAGESIQDALAEDRMLILGFNTYNQSVDWNVNGARWYGLQPRLAFSGSDHTLDISGNDTEIHNIWVDQTAASGSFDALRSTERETELRNVGCDEAPRYGFNFEGARPNAYGIYPTGGMTAAMRFNGAHRARIIGADVSSTQGDGIHIDGTSNLALLITGTSGNAGGDALVVNGTMTFSKIALNCYNPTGKIADIGSDSAENEYYLTGKGGAIDIGGDRDRYVITLNNADITFESTATGNFAIVNNRFFGSPTVVLGGTENIVYGQIDNLTYSGTRCVYNGFSQNSGDPSSTGDWNGEAAFAHRHGVTVLDTSVSPSVGYEADENGNWKPIDLLASAGYTDGETVGGVHYGGRNDELTTSSSTYGAQGNASWVFHWNDHFPDGAAARVRLYADDFDPNGDQIDVRIRNVIDNENALEVTGTTSRTFQTKIGENDYTPTTTSSIIKLNVQIKNSDNATTVTLSDPYISITPIL